MSLWPVRAIILNFRMYNERKVQEGIAVDKCIDTLRHEVFYLAKGVARALPLISRCGSHDHRAVRGGRGQFATKAHGQHQALTMATKTRTKFSFHRA